MLWFTKGRESCIPTNLYVVLIAIMTRHYNEYYISYRKALERICLVLKIRVNRDPKFTGRLHFEHNFLR